MGANARVDEEPYLRLDGITKSFGRFQALHGIDLAIERGELVTFLGPSGCGKTTLLRIVAGLETQDTGTIVQDGRDISRLPAIQRDYGIVFQSYALFPNLTIDANVAYGLVNRRKGRNEIERARRRAAEAGRVARQRRQVPGTALRRPAAADRARAGARLGSRAAAARRAAVGARRARAPAAARRDPRAAAAPRRDDDPGHPRPGGSAVDGGPHRGDERGSHRAGRHAARSLRNAGHAVRRRFRRQDQRAARRCRKAAGSFRVGGQMLVARPRRACHWQRGEALPAPRGHRACIAIRRRSGVRPTRWPHGSPRSSSSARSACWAWHSRPPTFPALVANVPRQAVDAGGLEPGALVAIDAAAGGAARAGLIRDGRRRARCRAGAAPGGARRRAIAALAGPPRAGAAGGLLRGAGVLPARRRCS